MLSFIIIGRNEGWKLTKCLQSVFNTIEYNKLNDSEVIYVDSKSTDDSIKRAKKFLNIKIFQLTGDYNAAIARNVGVKKSIGDILFFIDGDMEIIPGFLPLVYNKEKGLIQDFVSGNWVNYFYDKRGRLIKKEKYRDAKEDSIERVTGGLFLIKKEIWNKIDGMNPIFKISQDIDFGLRLAKRGVKLYRKKDIAAHHHTIAYLDKNRMWKDLIKGNHLYARSMLYRKHVFNKQVYPRLFRHDYSLIILFITTILIILNFSDWVYTILPYFLLLFYKSFRERKKNSLQLIINISFYFLRDLTTFLGLFIFWPSKNFKIEVKYMNYAS